MSAKVSKSGPRTTSRRGWRRPVETDVHSNLLERPPGQFGRDPVAHCRPLGQLVERARALDGEDEPVPELKRLRGEEIGGSGRLVVPAPEVHVFRRACARSEAEVKRQRAFEQLATRRDDEQPCQQAVEDDGLAQPDAG